MQVHRYLDPQLFLDHTHAWLTRAEVENALILGIARRLAATTPAQVPYLATVEDAGEVVAWAIRTPPNKAIITRADPTAITCLVEDLANEDPPLPAILGPEPAARLFAEAWSHLHGTHVRAGMQSRLFEIREVRPLPRRPSGRLRVAVEADHPILRVWAEVFLNEAGVSEAADPDQAVHDRIQHGSLFVWDDGRPVSMAAWAGRTPTGIRVNFVYTPAEHRRRGYATACVADLTRQLLTQGHAFCCLYTDLANPTSNGIYQAIGYRPVCDTSDYLLR